ncbi:glycosyltransferase family 4 protein [Cruoricaptor ignavus]|uniref:glycosyltransferase family 4 protein n=1 Tax=Cruoricaptor ignavus TaxID=1118202 RepID=UPI00370D7CE4
MKPKVIRISTVPMSINHLLKGQLQFLSQHFEIVAVSGEGKDLDECAEREGVRTVPIEMRRKISVLQDLKSLIQLYFLFRKEKPQIVHSITPKAGLLSMLAAKFAGVPIRVHTFTGLIFPYRTGFLQKVLIQMDRLLCKAATSIYPEGKGVREDLIRYKITDKPMKILANGNINGVDLQHFNPGKIGEKERAKLRQTLWISEKDFVFIFLGRLVREKGITELFDAFTKLDDKSEKPVKLLLIGPFEKVFDELPNEVVEGLEAHPNIILTGFQKDVRKFYAISNALVFPSYREGFPNTVLEAGAMNLPSIVTDISGCNEIIENGKNGIIIPPKSADKLFDAMRLFLDNPLEIKKMGEEARMKVEQNFDNQTVWNAVLNEYQDLLKTADSAQ